MKKIFNYALLAAALLVGVNVNAGKVAKVAIEDGAITEYATLEEAFAGVNTGETATITMLDDADFGTCRIDLSGKHIVWDLAGKTVGTAPAAEYSGFVMNGGYFEMVNLSTTPATLNLKEKWGKNASGLTGDHAGYVIMIFGSKDDVANYSTFIMDGDIRYTALGVDNYAIKVEGNPANNKNAFGVTVDIKKGYVYGRYGALFVSGNIKATTENRPVIKVEKDAELEASDQCTFLTGSLDDKEGKGDLKEAAKYYARKTWSDENKWTEPEAKAWAQAYKESSAAIYGGGVAEWTINGYVHGGNGLYIKGGNVVLNGARVAATAAEYHEPILKGSGFLACGSAIILDTNAGYAGVDGITISNSIVTSDNGYAIEEVVTQAGAATGIPDIVVESGTFVGGQGAITTTEDARDKIKTGGTITGGEWHNSDVTQYLDPDKNTVLEFEDADHKHYQVVVPISKEAMESTIADAAAKEAGERYAYIKENVSPEVVDVDRTIDFLLVDSAATVIVKSGATLDAGTLMTEGSQIAGKGTGKVIVEAGGTLIVSGKQGAYTYDENSLVVKASQTTSGQILINPAVVLNTTPKATVEFVSGSYYKNSIYVFQFFGAPMLAGSVKSVTTTGSANCAMQVNRGGSNWENIGTIINGTNTINTTKFDVPFGFYSIQSTNDQDNPQTYVFKGEIFGNTSPKIDFEQGWPGFSNAYLANTNVSAFFYDVLFYQTEEPSIYTYNQVGQDKLVWTANNPLDWSVKELKPMNAFMLRNTNEKQQLALNYTSMVWDPSQNPKKAPRVSNVEKASIFVKDANGVYDKLTIAQDDQFTAAYDKGFDAEKYMNTELNIYVKGEKNLAIAATDNLNNTFVGFNCKNAGKYTMSFENVTGNFALVDTKTNARINVVEGNTYEFLAEAGEDAHRFMIVEAAKAPTEMQKINAAVKTTKALINDQIVISNGERFFNVLGAEVK